MAKKHVVTLTEDERAFLRRRISAGSPRADTQMHARILLKADEAPGGPSWTDHAVATALEISVPTSSGCASDSPRRGWRRHWPVGLRDGSIGGSWMARRRRT